MPEYVAAPGIGRVVGENLRRLRKERGLTQDEVARLAVDAGLPWTRARLALLEIGRRDDLTLTELLLLGLAFDVSPDYWFEGQGRVRAGHLEPSRRVLRQLLGGRRPSDVTAEESPFTVAWIGVAGAITEADANAARRLGHAPERIHAAAMQLWGRGLVDEREARMAGDPERRSGRRGHITRALLRELEQALKEPV